MVYNNFHLRLLDNVKFHRTEFSFPSINYHMCNDLRQLHSDRIYMQYKFGLGAVLFLIFHDFKLNFKDLPRPRGVGYFRSECLILRYLKGLEIP